MRKVLLTTTALVALGGASAASAIDISGTYMFDYTVNDNGTANTAATNNSSMSSDARIVFSGDTTTDAGITYGGMLALDATGTTEDAGLTMSGDFGMFMAGATDGVVDGMDNFMIGSDNVEVGAGTTHSTSTTNSNSVGLNGTAAMSDTATAEKVGYRSPEISGFQFGFSHTDAGRTSKANNNQWMLTYDAGFGKFGYGQTTIGAAAGTSADTDQSIAGAGFAFGEFGLSLSKGSDKVKDTNGDVSSSVNTNEYYVDYSGIENTYLYVQRVTSKENEGTNAGDKLEGTTIGLSYTIAPGVSALLETGSNDYTDATAAGSNGDQADYTRFGLSVNF